MLVDATDIQQITSHFYFHHARKFFNLKKNRQIFLLIKPLSLLSFPYPFLSPQHEHNPDIQIDQANKPGVARFTINIQLEILVLIKETSALLEYGKMSFVSLIHHVQVISLRQLGFHLDHLTVFLGFSNGVRISVLTCKSIRILITRNIT